MRVTGYEHVASATRLYSIPYPGPFSWGEIDVSTICICDTVSIVMVCIAVKTYKIMRVFKVTPYGHFASTVSIHNRIFAPIKCEDSPWS